MLYVEDMLIASKRVEEINRLKAQLSRTFAMNLLTTQTTCEILGLVDTIAYIKFPTAFAYGTRDIYFFYSLVLGLKSK